MAQGRKGGRERDAHLDVCGGGPLGQAGDLDDVAARGRALDGKTALLAEGLLEGPVCDAKVHLGRAGGRSVCEAVRKGAGVLVVHVVLPCVVDVALGHCALLLKGGGAGGEWAGGRET